ncbi:hypothetical protein M422DRAFT_257311 [Sphaerobolus stellatus SS14]|uniref:Uncharacterized protein n=1 Tax=Sphaerobolus stellatus (strain SS14) TaxID=990650 RepID=A0A0C9VQ59_SPHS4|nr:hypothetical protein M422DRAFT_257311 [Sphaerobolus stellatus SS14]
MMEPAPGSGAEECARTTHSCVPGDRYSQAPLFRNIPENIPHSACGEQSDDLQPKRGREAHTVYTWDTPEAWVSDLSRTRFARDICVTERTRVNPSESMRPRRDGSPINTWRKPVSANMRDRPSLSANQVIREIPESIEHSRCSITEPQSIDMNALREEIKAMISATIKEKLRSDADSVTTVSQSMQALDANAQYWSDLSNKATRRSCRALELQLKLAEEKVNNLLHEEAPEEALLEAAREARSICFQLDQSSRLREAGLMPEQQVQFRANTGRNIVSPSRNYGPNPIIEPHIHQSEVNVPFGRQSTPALSINAQLDGAVVDMTSEYSGIQQMVRQALQNASLEDEPEKSFLAKAGVKMGTPPTYSSERNLEKFEKRLQLLGQCLTDEAQEWFYRQVERFDREVKHWDLESVLMGLQKQFMPTLLLNKVAVGYDHLMQGSMNVQQLHQQLTKLAKQMVELPDVYSYRRRFMNALKPSIREEVLGKGFTAEFSKIDELVEQAVIVDNAKCYTSGYNSNQSSAYANKPATVDHKCVQQLTPLNRSSNANAGSSNQNRAGNNNFQNRSTPHSINPVKPGNTVNKPTQSNPVRTAPKANNPVVCFNYNKPGHIRPNCPFPEKDRRIAGARIEEVILEEDEGQIEEFDEYAPHPEEQQEVEDQPEEDDQQYHFNDDEEYETRSIDNDVVHVNAVIKASGYNDCHRLYGIRVSEAEADLRVSAVLPTGGKGQPVYDHRARKKAHPLPTRGKENETISVFWDIGGTKAHCLLDSGCEGIMISSNFVRANKLPKFELEKPYGLTAKILLGKEKYDEYFDITNVDYYDVILGTPFLRWFEILLDFKNNCVHMGKLKFPNRFGSLTPTEADENEDRLRQEKPKAISTPTPK